MNNQFCKVGATTPITSGSNALNILEYRYQVFLEKAKEATSMNNQLEGFFKRKAEAFKNILDSLA